MWEFTRVRFLVSSGLGRRLGVEGDSPVLVVAS